MVFWRQSGWYSPSMISCTPERHCTQTHMCTCVYKLNQHAHNIHICTTYTFVPINVHLYKRTQSDKDTHIRTHTHKAHTFTHAHTHAHTQTHTKHTHAHTGEERGVQPAGGEDGAHLCATTGCGPHVSGKTKGHKEGKARGMLYFLVLPLNLVEPCTSRTTRNKALLVGGAMTSFMKNWILQQGSCM